MYIYICINHAYTNNLLYIYIKIFRVYSSLLFTLTALETDFHINLCACVEICMLENPPT